MRIGNLVIFKEKPGVVSKEPIWICFHSCWMYAHTTLLGLSWRIIKEWKSDRNLIG